jgi:chromosome partitioning protein
MDDIGTAATFVPKGSVGKTTTTAHIAVAATQHHNLDVAILDLAGEQNDIARHFGVKNEIQDPDVPISGISEDQWWRWQQQTNVDPVEVMRFKTEEGPDIIPADPGLGGAGNNLANTPREDRYGYLQRFTREFLTLHYDVALFDLPGKEDNIAINGLVTAQDIVAPLRPGGI